jgi:hypothetical protein
MPTVNYRNQQFNFPDDATMEEIHNHLNRYDVMNPSTNLPNPTQPSSAENPIPQFSKRDAQNLGAKQAVGSAIPIIGGMLGGISGTAVGSVVKNALQGYAPEFFGETPATTGGAIWDIAKDTALQGIIPKAVSAIPGGISALAKRVTTNNPTLKQYITDKLTDAVGSESDIVTKAAKRVQQNLPGMPEFNTTSKVPTSLIDEAGNPITRTITEPSSLTQRTVLGRYLALPPEKQVGPVATYINKTADETMADVTQVRNLKMTAGANVTEQLALNKAVRSGFSGGPDKLDISAIQKELMNNPDTYGEALSPATQDNFTEFLKKAKDLEPEKGSGGVDSMLRYAKHRLIFNIGAGLAGAIAGHVTGAPFATEAGIVGSLYIGNKALTALMQSPTMGKLTIQALETPSGSEASKVLSQVLLYGMRGIDANFIDSEGNKEKVQISNDGQLQLKP